MKKLLSLPLMALSFSAFAQSLEGANEEHLHTYSKRNSNGLTVQRIALKTGVTLEYVQQGNGQGTPVIFLHGLSDSWHSFETVFAHLPASVRAFAISQRGHGDSERPIEGYTPKHFAADVAAFIQQKGLGAAIIAGHSMGGIHAQQFALDYPLLTKAMVIIASDPAIKKNAGMPEFYQQVMKMEGALSYDFMDEFQKATLAKPIDSAYYRLLVDEGLKVPSRVFKAALKGLMEVDFSGEVKKIYQPALIFWGDKDAFFLREGRESFAKKLKSARLVVYEGIGHALHWEEPARFVNDLLQFIQSAQLDHHETKAKN